MAARRLEGIERGEPITLTVNGQCVQAYAGESLAAALLAAGWRAFRRSDAARSPRGLFCGMGMCYECLVTVNGAPNVRSCLAEAQAGSVVTIETDGPAADAGQGGRD